MGSGISTINNLGLAGMQTAQTGMANVATNVSGAAVDGFTRRQIHPLMTSASTNPLVQGGTVIIDSVVRSYSALINTQFLANHAKVRESEVVTNAGQIMDRLLVDEAKGLTEVFNSFFTSASDLSADPASGTARTAFATNAVELTDRIRNLAATTEETRRQALFQMSGVVNEVNEKSESLARVNLLIRASSAYGKPLPSADLLDERDRLSGKLSDLTGAAISVSDVGEAILRFSGISLVEGGQFAKLETVTELGGLPTGLIRVGLPRGENNKDTSFAQVATLNGNALGGEFGGLMRYANGAETWLTSLDQVAQSLVNAGNPLKLNPPEQWYSKVANGSNLAKLGFLDEKNIFRNGIFRVAYDVNSNNQFLDPTDPSKTVPTVRTLRPSLTLRSNIASGESVPWIATKVNDPAPVASSTTPADQSFAIRLSGQRSTSMRGWSEWVSGVSADLARWRAEEASFTAVDTSLRQQREQISGVDLDEEATDLLRFQQIYQANSSVIQASSRMFDVILSATGR